MGGNLLSGPLVKAWGPAVMYSMSAGVALIGLAILLWKLREIEARTAGHAS